jgi:predicted P-loop ATPase
MPLDNASGAPSAQASITFLHGFAPAGPWVLTAISEGKHAPTATFNPGQEEALARWVTAQQADRRNIYFLVGEPKKAISKKASKRDMARSNWLWCDVDARKDLDWRSDVAVQDEMDAIKARLDACPVPPTVIIASGGGYQAFWRLVEPFELGGAVEQLGKLEALNQALSNCLGGDHCHNADRIMRLPGTINYPNAVKRERGREPALAHLVSVLDGAAYALDAFDVLPRMETPALAALPKKLQRAVQAAPAAGDRSTAFFAACCALFEHGLSDVEAVAAFEGAPAGVASKFIERGDLAREVATIRGKWKPRSKPSARAPGDLDWPDVTKAGDVQGRSQPNITAFLDHVGVTLSYDEMAQRLIVTRGGKSVTMTDDVQNSLWLEADLLGLPAAELYFGAVLENAARKNGFHPVREYLDSLSWDGTARLDSWLSVYLGAENTALNAAYGRKHLIAAVRRVRRPGVKYDTILVLQGRQGAGKSSALRALCPADEYFSDSLSVGADRQEVMELTGGKWIVEMAELDGLTKRDAGTIKAMLSRQTDEARMAYGRHKTEAPRQFVLFGTVNDAHFLRDATGNRRFWPVMIGGTIDPDAIVSAITQDRDQLWAEAATYESRSETITLPKTLWQAAAEVQSTCMVIDPWSERLSEYLYDKSGFVPSMDIYDALGVCTEKRNGVVAQRVAGVLSQLGYRHTQRRVSGKPTHGYANDADPV